MAIELMKEPLKIIQAVGEGTLQFSVQGDVIIPDIKPDIIRVLYIDSDIVIDNEEALQDRVREEGTVNFRIIYFCSDENRPVRSLNASLPFKEPVDLAGAKTGMEVSSYGSVLNTEFEILNERKIMVKAVAQINVRTDEVIEASVITDVSGIDDIQKLRDNIRLCAYIGEETEKCTVREEIELDAEKPPVFEILKTDVRAIKDVKLSDDKIIVSGELAVSTLYTADDEEGAIQTAESEISFNRFIDIMGLHEDAFCDVDIAVKDVQVRIADNEEGDPRILDYEIEMVINGRGFEWKEINIVSDAYSPLYGMDMEGNELAVTQPASQADEDLIVKDTFKFSESGEVDRIYTVLCTPEISGIKTAEDKAIIEGAVNVWVLYEPMEGSSLMAYKHEIPYQSTIEVKGARPGMTARAEIKVEYCDYTMLSGGEVEVRVVLKVSAKAYDTSNFTIITNMGQKQLDIKEIESQPSITMYYVKTGDSLWKIGKKFNTTIEELLELNEMVSPDSLSPGQQIIIQKKAV